MRLNTKEKLALKFALNDFSGEIFLFGSRLDDNKKGGDIDILLMPNIAVNKTKLAIKIESKFFSKLEQKLDVLIYDKNDIFSREVLKNAKRFDFKAI